MQLSLNVTQFLSTQEKPSFGSVAISLHEFTHPSNKHLLSMCLLYSQSYTMNNRDDGKSSFHFYSVFIF